MSDGCVEGASDDLHLLVARQPVEVHGVTRHTHRQLRVLLWVLDGIEQRVSVEDIDVEVVCHLPEVSVEECREVLLAGRLVLADGRGHEREGVADAVTAVGVVQLGHRVERCQRATRITAMHWVGARCERFSLLASVGCGSGGLAVDDVGGDGEDRQGGLRVAVRLVLTQTGDHSFRDPFGEFVDSVVIVAVLGELALYLEVRRDAPLVAHRRHLGISDRTQRVSHHRYASDAVGHEAVDIAVVEGHLEPFVEVFVVHVVDAVHGVGVHPHEPVEGLLELSLHLGEVQGTVLELLELRTHLLA
mmetsp:Transcript_27942/g.69736  ORF Transcript_27942/g.69736 Transcript_27942/m.69736 type:complete len:303 (-) Transcript_27942:1411-2319(-)